MKAVKVDYDRDKDCVQLPDSAAEESWVDVCERYNNDVHRVRDADEKAEFSGLYECIDDDSNSFWYLVSENSGLYKAKHKVFLSKSGVIK